MKKITYNVYSNVGFLMVSASSEEELRDKVFKIQKSKNEFRAERLADDSAFLIKEDSIFSY